MEDGEQTTWLKLLDPAMPEALSRLFAFMSQLIFFFFSLRQLGWVLSHFPLKESWS